MNFVQVDGLLYLGDDLSKTTLEHLNGGKEKRVKLSVSDNGEDVSDNDEDLSDNGEDVSDKSINTEEYEAAADGSEESEESVHS